MARTTCRICESACGLVATVDAGRVVGLRADEEHPVSKGYACRKGTHFHEVANRPDRLLQPLVRGVQTDWDTALGVCGSELSRLLELHGPDSVGIYSGNAMGHSLGGVLGVTALQRALNTDKHYSCLTLDNSEMFAVAEWVFGHALTTFVADYAAADCTVLFGTDPLSSQPSQAQSQPGAVRTIAAQRAGLTVVDPRLSATAKAAAHHLQPRVGTDVFLLAWLVRCVADGPLRDAVESFTLERTTRVTGVPRDALESLRDRVLAAERPLIWSGLGVLLGPQGTLGWWLTVCLQALTGGIPGTWRPSPAGHLRRLMSWLPVKGSDPAKRSRIGNWPAILDTLPAATLADDILMPGEGQLRALIVAGGEPLRALPDSRYATKAFESLEFLVVVGVTPSRVSAMADVVLPAATWLEREESAVHMLAQRAVAHARRDPPVVPPPGACRPDWDILRDLARSTGRPAFGSRILDRLVTPARVPLLSGGSAPTPEARLAVPHLCAAIADLMDPDIELRVLSTVRPPGGMNHWIRPSTEPTAAMHPDDRPGPRVRIRGPAGELTVEVRADPTLARGTVVLPYAATEVNTLIGCDDLEPFSGQPLSNGVVVRVEADVRNGSEECS